MILQSATLPAYFVFLFPFLFVGLWIGVCTLIGIMSGWSTLARRFLCDTAPVGETRTAGPFFYSVYMRSWCHYSSVIRMTAATDALYLSVSSLFRAGHPPLRIPWNEIQFQPARLLWNRLVLLVLGSEEQIPMRISERMARNLGITDRLLVPGGNASR